MVILAHKSARTGGPASVWPVKESVKLMQAGGGLSGWIPPNSCLVSVAPPPAQFSVQIRLKAARDPNIRTEWHRGHMSSLYPGRGLSARDRPPVLWRRPRSLAIECNIGTPRGAGYHLPHREADRGRIKPAVAGGYARHALCQLRGIKTVCPGPFRYPDGAGRSLTG